jgi:hypothetical protein
VVCEGFRFKKNIIITLELPFPVNKENLYYYPLKNILIVGLEKECKAIYCFQEIKATFIN